MRALIVVRLSRVTDATTSPERQLAACRELCDQRGYEVVGVAEDLDVSAGKTTPFNRPALSQWLTGSGVGTFDVIVVYRMDRLVRRLLDLADMIRWGQNHGVALVSATEAFLDLTQPFGDVIALLVAKVAEMELEAISERNASAFRHNIRAGKYRGGIPPWGYAPQRDDDGDWRLVQDPAQVEVIREVVERVLKGEPLRAIAHDLTKRGVPTPRDCFAALNGREMQGYEWHSGPLKRSLTSPTMIGRVTTREALLDAHGRPQRDAKGRKMFGDEVVVTGDDGTPIQRAEPILSREIFERVGVELADRENRKEPTVRSSGLLLRVLYCGECGKPAYRLKGGKGRKPRYRCASMQSADPCGNRTVSLEWADDEVEKKILSALGPLERKRRIWFAGTDHSDELREVNDLLSDLTDQLGTGAFKRGTPQRARLDQRIQALTARQEELGAEPAEAAGWVWEPTGELFADWWERQDTEARNVWLRQMDFKVTWTSHTEGSRTILDTFKVDGDLTLNLDADQTFGPLLEMVAAYNEGAS
ncbi:recombinase family protein [Tsukamurella strandjordii]|uniref:Recombinase family protein n=1 Tax=Tsukamurella strandjordii TaxID=147577 RepID=A0AA90NHP0_9ACTN|nr:recombinase family protein [Tsukamurella strandjordii]MDP0398531.1 recombinase family protein [Tsukamurella strandjordii]